MGNDPWKDIVQPTAANALSAKRVDAALPWGFFWARGLDGKCLFVIQHSTHTALPSRLPRLRGLDVTESEWVDGNSRVLIFKLEDAAHRDLFHQVCLDITACAGGAGTEQEAVTLAIARIWRWHHLLRGGSDSRLTLEEQKGLIGELLVLERHLLPVLGPVDGLSAWQGPLGAPKDFAIGHACVEVKARRGSATPHVAISCESQLDGDGVESLFLYVVDLDRASSGSANRFTLTDIAARIRETVSASHEASIEPYEGLLAAGGFRWSDDYSDTQWIEGTHRVYGVTQGFPRITASTLVSGVRDVRYSISLVTCQPFLTDMACLDSALRGDSNGL